MPPSDAKRPIVVHVSPYDVIDDRSGAYIARKRKWLLFIDMTWYFAVGLLGPLYAVFASQVGGDILDIATIYAVYLLVAGSSHLLFGWLMDKYNVVRHFMILGCVLVTLSTFSYLLVTNTVELLIVEVAYGLSDAMATPSWSKLYTDTMDVDKVSQQWSYDTGGAAIVSGFAILIGGVIAMFISFALLFIVMGSFFAAMTVVAIFQYGRGEKLTPCAEYGAGCGIGVAMPHDLFVGYAVDIAKKVIKTRQCDTHERDIITSGIQTTEIAASMRKAKPSARSMPDDTKLLKNAVTYCKRAKSSVSH